ncbi:MAG: hypothetical protein IT428_06065 [Planctomycetaceae bacterium]|nr:hypothetical protein [Planctomycetaceae bacterium]
MRSMSFMLTTDQVRNCTKTVTRRIGWADLKPGTLLRAVVKCQGLRKGERMEPLAVICVINVRHERLCEMTGPYGAVEVVREGFPGMAPADFVEMFSASHGDCGREAVVTRIEFRYVPGGRLETNG